MYKQCKIRKNEQKQYTYMFFQDKISENMSLINTSSRKVDHTKRGALADVKSSWVYSQNSTRKAIMRRNGVCE